jgi:hypothetical protein
MPVKAADPSARALDDAFAGAMGAPARPKEPAAPPELDKDAPHGRDEATNEPLAPYGYTRDGAVRKSAAGRKSASADDKARTGPPAVPVPPPGKPLEVKDFSESLTETADSAWLLLTFAAQLPLEKIPILPRIPVSKTRKIGDYLAGAELRLHAQAAILHANKVQLVAALNIAAQNNAQARRLAEKLETGDVTWVMMFGAMVAPFLAQSRALWTGELDVRQLAESNKASFEQWTVEVASAMAAAAIVDSAQLNGAAGPST